MSSDISLYAGHKHSSGVFGHRCFVHPFHSFPVLKVNVRPCRYVARPAASTWQNGFEAGWRLPWALLAELFNLP